MRGILLRSIGSLAASLFMLSGANAALFFEIEANDTIVTAQNIDGAFDLSANSLIENSAGVNTSTFVPHVEILSVGDFSVTSDFYSFTASAGDTVVLDIDCVYAPTLYGCGPSPFGTFDALVVLYDPGGAPVFANDDSSLPIDTGSATGGTLDSFLEIVLPVGGLWAIEVDDSAFGPIPAGGEYILNVSLAPVPVPAAVWLFGSALGLLGWMKRKT
jgi:hypothetical protein